MATRQLTENVKEQNRDLASGETKTGLGGANLTDVVDPIAEEAYWRESYGARPYFDKNIPIEIYMAAYRYGWESRVLYDDMDYRDVEAHLRRQWNRNDKDIGRGLSWDRAKHAIRDAWERVTNAFRAKEKVTRSR